MGKQFEEITPELRGFIERQHLFFVASAPLSGHGSVNASPKGAAGDTFRIVDERSVFYVDLTGSGTETAAHLRVAWSARTSDPSAATSRATVGSRSCSSSSKRDRPTSCGYSVKGGSSSAGRPSTRSGPRGWICMCVL